MELSVQLLSATAVLDVSFLSLELTVAHMTSLNGSLRLGATRVLPLIPTFRWGGNCWCA